MNFFILLRYYEFPFGFFLAESALKEPADVVDFLTVPLPGFPSRRNGVRLSPEFVFA